MTRVLVIDDEPAIRDVLIEFLGHHGYEATGAASGREGLKIARRLRPVVVLLDIVMPGWNGLETLEKLRQECPATAVIMISGHSDNEHALKALDLGAYDFIQKPLDFRYLERTLLAKIVTLEPDGGSPPSEEAPGERRKRAGQGGG